MTALRIAHAEPRPGNLGNGVFMTNGYLVVLADDVGHHRSLARWVREAREAGLDNESMEELLRGTLRAAADEETA